MKKDQTSPSFNISGIMFNFNQPFIEIVLTLNFFITFPVLSTHGLDLIYIDNLVIKAGLNVINTYE